MGRATMQLDPAPEYAGAYRANGGDGVAWRVDGWETEPLTVTFCPDCSFHAVERDGGGGRTVDRGDDECEHEHAYQSDELEHERTGRLACHMVGDDATHYFDPDDLVPIARKDYCGECGQIGCGCDAYDDE